MKTNILYFTRTAETQKLAKELEAKTNCPVYEVKDNGNWNGALGMIKGMWYSLINKQMDLQFDPSAIEADRLIVMSPHWLNGPAPAIKTLLGTVEHDNVYLVLSNHASPIDGALASNQKKYSGVKKAFGITGNKNNSEEVLTKIAAEIAG